MVHNISNLYGIGLKSIKELNDKGIFTVEELLASDIKLPQSIETAAVMYPFEVRVTRERADFEYKTLKKLFPSKDIIIAGSYRRGLDDMKDIDVLVISDDQNEIDKMVTKMVSSDPKRYHVVASGTTKAMIYSMINNKAIKIDLVRAPKESKWIALVHYTGSVKMNIKLRFHAKKRKLKINEKCIESLETGWIYFPKSEKEVFEAAGVDYLTPTKRSLK